MAPKEHKSEILTSGNCFKNTASPLTTRQPCTTQYNTILANLVKAISKADNANPEQINILKKVKAAMLHATSDWFEANNGVNTLKLLVLLRSICSIKQKSGFVYGFFDQKISDSLVKFKEYLSKEQKAALNTIADLELSSQEKANLMNVSEIEVKGIISALDIKGGTPRFSL